MRTPEGEPISTDLGEVDTLLYNAGSGVFADVETITADQFEQAWRVNALGSFPCSREVIPAMKAGAVRPHYLKSFLILVSR